MSIAELHMPLAPGGVTPIGSDLKTPAATGTSKNTFAQLLESLGKTQNESDGLFQKLAAGDEVDLHQVMIASEQTDISFRVATALRDRLVEAYREVTRMAV